MAHSSARFSLNAFGVTTTPAQSAAVRARLDQLRTRMRPFATGETYLNFLDVDAATPIGSERPTPRRTGPAWSG